MFFTEAANTNLIPIKVSARSARLKFIECGPVCIANGCKAKCCDAPKQPTGMLVTVHKDEQALVEAQGGVIVEGRLQPISGHTGCPFKTSDYLCSLHGTPAKPFGCRVSPFMLNKNDTLIIRHRYIQLPCYDPKQGDFAYRTFRDSLVLIFGDKIVELVDHLDKGFGDKIMSIEAKVYNMMKQREVVLHKK